MTIQIANLVFVFFLLSSLVSVAHGTTCSVVFYWNSGYSGPSFTLYAGGSYPDLTKIYINSGNTNWNDQISGLYFNPGTDGTYCWVHACWNTYCSGWESGGSNDYIDDTPFVGGFANDVFSSVTVSSYKLTDPYIMYYKACFGTLDYAWFTMGSLNTFVGDLGNNCIGNDALSAMVVSTNAAVILYSDDQWEGNSILFTGQTVQCLTSWSGWNDVTSSARQYSLAAGAFNKPSAQWVQIGSGPSISQTITYGITTSESTTTTSTFETQITDTVSAGFDIEGVSASNSISVSVSETFALSLSSSITKSETSSWTVSCNGVTTEGGIICPSGEIIMYNFQMTFLRPWSNVPGLGGDTLLATSDTQCICSSYGPPQCVPGHCADNKVYSCSVCNY